MMIARHLVSSFPDLIMVLSGFDRRCPLQRSARKTNRFIISPAANSPRELDGAVIGKLELSEVVRRLFTGLFAFLTPVTKEVGERAGGAISA
jgi:hypothetical protein